MKNKILIIKLESLGDVLRTTPLLHGIHDTYARPHVSWLTAKEALPLLENNRLIDRLLVFDLNSTIQLQAELFSQVISLDKSKHACALASLIKARTKKGFGLNPWGNIYPLSQSSDYALRLGIDDELKFRNNKRTYQDVIFEIAELKFRRQPYVLELSHEQLQLSRKIKERMGAFKRNKIIGINTGCGNKFPYKKWNESAYSELVRVILENTGNSVLLLGGSAEKKKNVRLQREFNKRVFLFDSSQDIRNFIALINCCDALVTGDTLAMHIGIALKKKIVALFGPTSASEVDLYGVGEYAISRMECAPCYKNTCERNGECMDKITAEEVFGKISHVLSI